MSKLRLIFILSLFILAGMFILTLYLIPTGKDYPESHSAQVIRADNEWILQYDIINNQDRDIKYIIQVTIDDAVYTDSTAVRAGKAYTYIHHIHPEQLSEGRVILTLYEEGKVEPVEQTTYYIDID